MKVYLWRACAAAVTLAAVPACTTLATEEQADAAYAPSSRDGAMALMPILDGEAGPTKNFVFSPLSINLAFGLLHEGAAGETRTQIETILPPPADPLGIASNRDDVEVRVANALFLDKNFRFRDSYVAATTRKYRASATKVDYTNTEASAKVINAWADEATKGLIPQVITPDAISPDMIAVLANALYFEGLWKTKLAGKIEQPFLFGNGNDKTFTFVTETFRTPHARDGAWEAVRLPYRNKRYAMDIIIPRQREVMNAAPSAALIEQMKVNLDAAEPALVQVEIPQFETDYSQSLVAPLMDIGLTLPFTVGKADLSGMVEPGQQPIVVSDVRHVTKLQVYDEGTKAAAVTTISIVVTSAPMRPVDPLVFRADRPFMVVLRDLERDAVLFIGRIADPQPFEPPVKG